MTHDATIHNESITFVDVVSTDDALYLYGNAVWRIVARYDIDGVPYVEAHRDIAPSWSDQHRGRWPESVWNAQAKVISTDPKDRPLNFQDE